MGCLPKDLPPHSICYDYWRLLIDGGHMERINHDLVADSDEAGRSFRFEAGRCSDVMPATIPI